MEGPQFSLPPPNLLEPPPPDMGSVPPNLNMPPPNLSAPPPNMSMPPPNLNGAVGGYAPRFGNQSQQFQHRPFFRPFQPYVPRGPIGPMTLEDFDGKRLRKSVMRKTVDYNSAIIEALETRIWQRDYRDRRALQPDVMYYPEMLPPPSYPDNAMNCVCTRFVKTATNKMRCPIFCMAWTPEGRRLVTGASSGEFTLWNGLTFNFETILQAHDSPVRTMVWSHNDNWMVTGDHAGYVKYWQSNMNNVKMFQAHKEALRGISFSPTDTKFVTCSDDGTLRIWDFLRCHEERVLRGHGADVKCVHWHPQKGLVISGSKDNQQPIKLWDPKTGQSLATLHAHKSTVMDLKWNDNGNWLITASRDHLLKLFDLRNLSQEVQTFRGHKKEASNVAWHPNHEGLFASGGSDGAIMFWHVGADKEVGAIEQAHDSIVWRLAWHPLGHILCSGSNDHSSKFWTRNRPGDTMRDKYNLNTLPAGLSGLDDADIDEPSVIPGMGPEDRVEISLSGEPNSNALTAIPGLDLDTPIISIDDKPSKMKKVPYSKPIPRNFQAQWNDTGNIDDDDDGIKDSTISEVISHIVENTPGVVPLKKIAPSAIIVYGKCLPVEPGSVLEQKIAEGPEALKRYIASGAIEELHDVMPHEDEDDYLNDEYSDNDTNIPTLSVTNVKLPPPLPSSKLAKSIVQSNQSNLQNQAIQNQLHIANQEKLNANNSASKSERPRKSRFSDLNDSSDQDMRNYVTTPTRISGSNSLESLIRSKDQDMRYSTGSSGNSSSGQDSRLQSSAVQDEDLRQSFSRDPDFRNSGGNHNFSSGFSNMRRDELRSEQSQNSPKRTRFESPNQNQSSRSNERQDDNWQSQQNRHPWEMDSQGIGSFSNHNQGNFNLNSESNQNSQFTQSNQIPNLFSQTQTNPFSQNSQFNQNDSPNTQQSFMMNQNGGPFGNMNFGGQGPNNYRQSGSGPNFRPPFPHNNFRAEGPPGHWGPPRPDGFRGGRGGGYGPRGPPIRGGQRNFQGNNVRGRGPLRGANKGPMRGRNTFN